MSIPVHLSFCLLVGCCFLFVSSITQKNTQHISLKLGRRMGEGLRKNPLNLGTYPEKKDGSRNFYIGHFLTLSQIFQGIVNFFLKNRHI